MSDRWERNIPVYDVPIWTRPFQALLVLGALALGLVTYREIAGLGPASGMNDAYAWGIWKTFNIMVLTGLGSGGFAVGMAAWLFNRKRLHTVMRTALLTSFLAYASGLMLMGIDVGRPWNFYWVLMPWKWNAHSPLLEVAVCMPAYAMFPLLLENFPPLFDWIHDKRPRFRASVEKAEKIMTRFYPWVVALAYLLPAMHQSSLGALMLLAGEKVHPLWQTPLLPMFYVWAAAYMGFACVAGTLLFCSLVWHLPVDLDVIAEMNKITANLIGYWLLLRFADLAVSRKLGLMFQANIYSGLFWMETIFLTVAVITLLDSGRRRDAHLMFHSYLAAAFGGMLYRFNPTTLAFQPRPGAFYFPSAVEILISVGFVALAIAAFVAAAKAWAILPGPIRLWKSTEIKTQEEKAAVGKISNYAPAGD